MTSDDKSGKKGGGLLAWLRGEKRNDEAPKVDANKSTGIVSKDVVSQVGPIETGVAARLERDVALRYVDKGEIARGGMGAIRKVFDENLQRTLAMKVLFPELRSDPKIVSRFAEEAQIQGQLEHPNIVPVHDFGEEEGTRFLTMLYVRGKTLTDLLQEDATSSRERHFRFLNIFLKVCDAVAFAHSRGVIHRDLKPDNVMVGSFGEVYLMDWGIARLLHRTGGIPPNAGKTIAMPAIGSFVEENIPVRVRRDAAGQDETGQIIGTFFYMSPEQALAQIERIDERTDVFLLGGVLYEILTGQSTYVGSTIVDVVRQAQACQVLRPEMISPEARIPKALSDICMRCLQREQDDRYQSVLELKKDIENFLKGGASFPTRTFAPDQMLMEEGQPGEEVYLIESGTVQVYQTDKNGRRRGLATLGAGAVVGEASVFNGAKRSASVVAIDEVKALVVTRKQLDQELGLNSWIGTLVKALAARFFATNEKFTNLADEVQTLQLANWVLQYLTLYGSTGPSGRREVQWLHLQAACVHQFQKPEAEVRAILESTKSFTIDDGRNAFWFSAT